MNVYEIPESILNDNKWEPNCWVSGRLNPEGYVIVAKLSEFPFYAENSRARLALESKSARITTQIIIGLLNEKY